MAMINDVIHALAASVRGMWRSKGATAVSMLLFAIFLAETYAFAAEREASVAQVILTLAMGVVAPVLFFAFQSSAWALGRGERVRLHDRPRAARQFWKPLVASVPVALLAWGCVALLNWLSAPPAPSPEGLGVPVDVPSPLAHDAAVGFFTREMGFATARVLVYGVVLPLLAIHLWFAALRDGLITSMKHIVTTLRSAWSPVAMIIYLIGGLLFAVGPYYLLFVHVEVKSTAADMLVLALRGLLVFLLIFFGWTATLGALRAHAERGR